MNTLRRLVFTAAMTALVAGTMSEAQKTFTSYLTGIGTASETDRSTAMSEATEQAQNNASSPCVGNVVASSVLNSNCIPITIGDTTTYTCTVTVRATCQFQTNPRTIISR
jgi:predicted cobalt transporter CbtA